MGTNVIPPRYVPANDKSEEAKRISSIDHNFSSPVQVGSSPLHPHPHSKPSLPDEHGPGCAAEIKDCICDQPHSLAHSAPEVKGAGTGERLENFSSSDPQEYDVQKLKLSSGFGNSSELNRDLVVLVESSTPHQPSLVVEVEESGVGNSRKKSY